MHSTILETLVQILHIFVCAVLVLVVLLQQGKGGGMGAALGGGTATQVFGGRGAGNLLTRATSICAAIFMLTSVSLAYLSSSGDRAIKAKAAMESAKPTDRGTARPKDTKPTDAKPTDAKPGDAPGAPGDMPGVPDNAPVQSPSPAPAGSTP